MSHPDSLPQVGTSKDGGALALSVVPPCQGGAISDEVLEPETVPAWLAGFQSSTATIIDVRPILTAGREPIAEVLAAAEGMPQEGGLILLAPFNPGPLRSLLHERGMATYGRRQGERLWNIRVVRVAKSPSASRGNGPALARSSVGSTLKLGGATQRLLPEVIPLRFFGVALVAHALAWAGLVVFAEAFPGFRGGAGPVLGVLHLTVLGVFLATAMGASFQMLPVAFALPPPARWPCDLAFGLLVAGGAGLIIGFALSEPGPMVGGALMLGGAVTLHAVALARLVYVPGDNSLLRWHIGAALAAIACAVLLALGLAADFRLGWLENHQDVALAHFILAGFGFMGMFVLGFSQILIPMFSVAEPAGERLGQAAFVLATLGILSAVVGVLAEGRVLLIVGVLAGFGAALCHIGQMMRTLRGRMRTRLGPEFLLIRLAWLFFPVSLGLALLIVLDIGMDLVPTLFGFTLIFGWYLTFLLGVLQRILPFLASMHAVRFGAKALSPAKLTTPELLVVHQWCHLSALVCVGAGLILANIWLIRLGGLVGFVGAASFIAFGLDVLKKTKAHIATTASLKTAAPGRSVVDG